MDRVVLCMGEMMRSRNAHSIIRKCAFLSISLVAMTATFLPGAHGQDAAGTTQTFSNLAATRIERLADLLDEEVKSSAGVAKAIESAHAVETGKILLSEAQNGSAIATTTYEEGPSYRVTGNFALDELVRKQLTVNSLSKKSESAAEFSQYLRDLSESMRGSDPSEASQLLQSIHVPSDMVQIIVAPRGEGVGAGNQIAPVSQEGTSLLELTVGVSSKVTVDFPAVAAILYADATFGPKAKCTGTLITANAVLTAAHCLAEAPLAVYLQHAGIFEVDHVKQHDDFSFPYADLGLIFLKQRVEGIVPLPINGTKRFPIGTVATIVGFGWRNPLDDNGNVTGSGIVQLTGLKLSTNVRTADCSHIQDSPKSAICWRYDASSILSELGSTCMGDSGGPLIGKVDGRWVLAGTTSGTTNCSVGGEAVDVEVYDFSPWIKEELAKPENAPPTGSPWSSSLDPVTNAGRYILEAPYRKLTHAAPEWSKDFNVDASLRVLRVTVNATPSGGALSLKVFFKNTGGEACSVQGDTTVGACDIANPPMGPMQFAVSGAENQELQVVVTGF